MTQIQNLDSWLGCFKNECHERKYVCVYVYVYVCVCVCVCMRLPEP